MEDAAVEIEALVDRFRDSTDLVCIFDENDRIVYANDTFWKEYSWLDRSDPTLDFHHMFVEGSLRALRETARPDDEEIHKYAVYANWWRRTFPNDIFYRRHVSGRVSQVRQWRSNTGLHIQVRRFLTEAEQEELSERSVLDAELPAFVDHTGFVKEGQQDEVSYVTTTVIDHLDPPAAIIDARGMIIHASRSFMDVLVNGTAFSFDTGRLTPNSDQLAQQYPAMLQAAFSSNSRYPGGTILVPKGNRYDPQFLHLERVGMIEGRSGQWPAIVVVRLGMDEPDEFWTQKVDSQRRDDGPRLMTFDLPEAWKEGPPLEAQRGTYQFAVLTRAVEWFDQPIILMDQCRRPLATNVAARRLIRRSRRWRLTHGRLNPANRSTLKTWDRILNAAGAVAEVLELPGYGLGLEPWRVVRLARTLRHYTDGQAWILIGPRPRPATKDINKELKSLLELDDVPLRKFGAIGRLDEDQLSGKIRWKLRGKVGRSGTLSLNSLRRSIAKIAKR